MDKISIKSGFTLFNKKKENLQNTSNKINQNALNEVLKRNAIPNYWVTVDIINVINFVLKKESNAITGQLIYLGGVWLISKFHLAQ